MSGKNQPPNVRPDLRSVPPITSHTSGPTAKNPPRADGEDLCAAMQEVWSSAYDGEDLDEAVASLNNKALVNSTHQLRNAQPAAHFAELTLDHVEHHVSHCPSCLLVRQSTSRFRRVRVRTVDPTAVDLRPAIRAAITHDRVGIPQQAGATDYPSRRYVMAPSVLVALFITGLAQALGALPDLFGSVRGSSFSGVLTGVEHLTREAAASEIALAAGFVSVALKPLAVVPVRVFATVLTLLVILSTLTSASASSGGLALEAHHLIALFGTTLLWMLPKKTSPLIDWPFLRAKPISLSESSFSPSSFSR